ncbi:TetR/AcrR family transcriptional regulator [Thalassotalea euphylliae]|uniref:TetR/AcrR family transcriptional regulator n=1 Tax=Thalassotalea euphylliae TaxID=1655234 RepID=UPI003641DA57
MAKPAKFDREDVIDKAMNLYWHKGFHATSMRNLQDAIDMRPGSIYAAFGNKDGLFKEALKCYTNMGIHVLSQCKAEQPSALAALIAFVKIQVIESKASGPNGMCMLTKTLSELTSENQELIDLTKSHLAEVSSEFANVITQAQAEGDISKLKSAAELADYLQVQIAGLRTYAKINDDSDKLSSMIEDIFAHYPFA